MLVGRRCRNVPPRKIEAACFFDYEFKIGCADLLRVHQAQTSGFMVSALPGTDVRVSGLSGPDADIRDQGFEFVSYINVGW